MGKITIELDDETEDRLRVLAKIQQVSLDHCVAHMVREKSARWASEAHTLQQNAKLSGLMADIAKAVGVSEEELNNFGRPPK